MESAVQHGTAAFVAGLQATGAEGNPAQARGAWRCGKRSAFPTSPHPRRRLRTNFKRGATLTIYLVQKIGQVKIAALLTQLRGPCKTAVFLAFSTGLRVSELLGLKWEDVRFDTMEIRPSRAIVEQVIGPIKTEASDKPVPMDTALANVLMEWRGKCPFNQDS